MLMGEVPNYVLSNEGKVNEVMSKGLFEKEIAHTDLTMLHTVNLMHECKMILSNLAEVGIVFLGDGTMDECFEFLS